MFMYDFIENLAYRGFPQGKVLVVGFVTDKT